MIKRFKELSKNEFVRNVFTLMSATSIAQGIAILIYLVLAKIYSTSDHGIFALYMSIIAVTGIISTGKYEGAVMLPRDDSKAFDLVALSSILCVGFSVFLFLLIALFHHSFAILLGDPRIEKWLWFVPISTLLVGLFQSLSYWSNRNKRFGNMAVANVGQSLTNSAVKVSTSKVFANGGGLIAGAIIGQVVGILLFLKVFFKRDSGNIKKTSIQGMKEMAREYRQFPRFNMIHNLINNFSANLPVFVITSKFGAGEAGLYSFGFLMVYRPVNLITSSFSQVFSQRIISKYNQGHEIFPDVRRLVIKLFQIGILPFLVLGIFGPLIFSYFFGKQWIEAGRYVQILLPWIFVVLLSSPLSFIPDMLRKQQAAMWLDALKFTLRIPALAIGVYNNNIYLALILFSGVSFLSVGTNLYWYLSLARRADKTDIKNRNRVNDLKLLSEDVQNIENL